MAKQHVFPLRLDGATQEVAAATSWNGVTSLIDITTAGGAYDLTVPDAEEPGTLLTIKRSASGSNAVSVKNAGGDVLVSLDSSTDTACLIWTSSAWEILANATATGDLAADNVSLTGTLSVAGAATLGAAVKLDIASTTAVEEQTNRATGVTLNQVAGVVSTNAASLADGNEGTLTVTNSVCTANSVVIVSPGANCNDLGGGAFEVTPAAGSFTIVYKNVSGGAVTSAQTFRFVVLNLI